MTGTVQIKKGRPNYYIVLDYVDDTTGKRKRPWITTDIPVKGNNKRLANAKLKEVLAEYETTKVDLGKDVLFTEFIRQWLENLSHSINASTYDAYRFNVDKRIIPYFEPKKIKVKDLTPTHIQQYVNNYLKLVSANTVRKYLANISKCLDSAVKQNIIAFNPVKRIDLPKKAKYTGAKYYNENQIVQLLDYSKGDPLEIVILLTIFYGLRRSEVLGLRWDAVSFDNNTITIRHTVVNGNKTLHKTDSTKNDSSYAVVPMSKMIIHELKKWKDKQATNKLLQPNNYIDNGYICTHVDGNLIKPNYVSQHFSLLLKNNNLPHIRFHDLRHSAASYLLYLGFNLKEIQTWLRHGDIQTSMNLYTHMDMTSKRNIADSLNERFMSFELKN